MQSSGTKREILADATLKAVFGEDEATIFEINQLLSARLS